MSNTIKTIASRTTSGVLAAALAAGGLAGVVPAFAEDTEEVNSTGSTEVTAEVSTESTQLEFSVPEKIPFYVTGEGELIMADACVENDSVFGIHVTSIEIEGDDAWTFVSDAENSDEENAIDFQIGAEGYLTDAADTTDDDVSAISAYNMAYSDGERDTGDDTVTIVGTGNVANVTNNLDPDDATPIATITWTFAAGNVGDSTDEA